MMHYAAVVMRRALQSEMMKDNPFSLRISDDASALLTKLAAKLGVSKAAVFEMAIREFAKKNGVQ